MNDQADLVVIAKPVITTNTTEKATLPGISPNIPVIGNETRFEVRLVLKGDKNLKTIVLHHYQLANPNQPLLNGPMLAEFDPKQHYSFLLFLRRDTDGRYSPVTGQTDPALFSIIRLEGSAH